MVRAYRRAVSARQAGAAGVAAGAFGDGVALEQGAQFDIVFVEVDAPRVPEEGPSL